MSKTIDITNSATPMLRRLQGAVASGALANAMGAGARNRIQGHLHRINGERPNRLGGRRTDFYSAAAKSTHMDAVPGEITVTVSRVGFRQRFEGGRIRPVNKKFLTIPATAEAYGRRASEFADLRFVILGGRPALVRARQTRISIGGRRKDGTRRIRGTSSTTGMEVLFWLRREVNQKPDPSVLPTDAEIGEAAVRGGNLYLDTLKGGRRGG